VGRAKIEEKKGIRATQEEEKIIMGSFDRGQFGGE